MKGRSKWFATSGPINFDQAQVVIFKSILVCSGRLLLVIVFFLTSGIGSFAHQAQAAELSTLQRSEPVETRRQSSVQEKSKIKDPETVAAQDESRLSQIFSDAEFLLTSPARMDKQDALILGGVALGVSGLMLLDEEIRDFAQKNRSDTGDDIAEALDDIGSAQAVFAGNFVLLGAGWWFREDEAGQKLYETAWISLEAQVFTETAAGLSKLAVGRSRPNQDSSAYSFNPFSSFDFDRSFPSSHAARSFAVAAVSRIAMSNLSLRLLIRRHRSSVCRASISTNTGPRMYSPGRFWALPSARR